jgi:prepilin-type processing-associated H-X9-DG protein
MSHPFRWPAGAAATVLAAIALVLFAPGPRPVAAEPVKLPPGLNLVPADAALFFHADVPTILNSKIGQAVRAAKAKEIESVLTEIESKTGITLDTVKTFTVFLPQLKDPADFQSPVFYVTFTKPYDKAKVIAAMKKEFDPTKEKERLTEVQPGVFEVRDEDVDKKKGKEAGEPEHTIVLTDPMAIGIAGAGSRKHLKPAPAGDGPQTPALKAATEATATLGLNFAAFPDEIRGDNIPAEVRPFAPLFQSDAAVATAKFDGDNVRFEVRFRSADRRKVTDAEKSLAAGSTLLQAALGFAINELEKSKEESEKAVLPLAKEVLEMVKRAKITATDTEAVVATTANTDLPVGPFLQMAFGGATATGPAARAKDSNNLKQIGLALHNYHDTYEGFPPATLVDRKGKPLLSWRVLILPYIEQDALYREFKLDEPWDSEHNKKVLEKHPMPPVYALPGVTKDGEKTTHYQVFVGNGAAFDSVLASKINSFTDGTSNTVMVAPGAKAVPWTKPDDIEFDPKVDPRKLILFRNGGANFAFADGSVRYLKDTIAEDVLRAVITKGGGEVVNLD